MKTLYLIGGTTGIGTAEAGRALKELLPHAVFLDGDWCWEEDPFEVRPGNTVRALAKICPLLASFLRTSANENIIFSWTLHENAIINGILARLSLREVTVKSVSLVCGEEELLKRLSASGRMDADYASRSLEGLKKYSVLDTVKLDVTGLLPGEIARRIASL